jgi:hypothetical protein
VHRFGRLHFEVLASEVQDLHILQNGVCALLLLQAKIIRVTACLSRAKSGPWRNQQNWPSFPLGKKCFYRNELQTFHFRIYIYFQTVLSIIKVVPRSRELCAISMRDIKTGIINTTKQIGNLVDWLILHRSLPGPYEPIIYMDLEGVNLCHEGSVQDSLLFSSP